MFSLLIKKVTLQQLNVQKRKKGENKKIFNKTKVILYLKKNKTHEQRFFLQKLYNKTI